MVIETSLNQFDLIVFAIVGLSALLSFFRGFVREVLSLGAWVGASVITLYAFPTIAANIQPHVKSSVVASGLAAMGTFMIALICISIVNAILMRFLKKGSDIGPLDNILGLVFGVLRAGLLVSLAYFILSLMMTEEDMPEWLLESKSRPYIEQGAELIGKVAPAYFEEISNTAEGEGDDADANPDNQKSDPKVDAGESTYKWMNVEELQKALKKQDTESDR